ncbi:MAG: type III secretion system inner rod subunit SctI [Janthinobacterium lividum]
MSTPVLPLPGAMAGASLASPMAPTATSPLAPPGAHLVDRFESTLHGVPPDSAGLPDSVPNVAGVPDVAGVASGLAGVAGASVAGAANVAGMAPEAGMHAGERILAKLQEVSTSAGETWNRMTHFATVAGEPTMANLLQIQMSAMQASVQFDYLGKIISRTTQNIDQLIKTP